MAYHEALSNCFLAVEKGFDPGSNPGLGVITPISGIWTCSKILVGFLAQRSLRSVESRHGRYMLRIGFNARSRAPRLTLKNPCGFLVPRSRLCLSVVSRPGRLYHHKHTSSWAVSSAWLEHNTFNTIESHVGVTGSNPARPVYYKKRRAWFEAHKNAFAFLVERSLRSVHTQKSSTDFWCRARGKLSADPARPVFSVDFLY